jgi:hypothetical protein
VADPIYIMAGHICNSAGRICNSAGQICNVADQICIKVNPVHYIESGHPPTLPHTQPIDRTKKKKEYVDQCF